MMVRDEIDALWSAEGQAAALSACVVALADALSHSAAASLDDRLSAPDFDFTAVVRALGPGQGVAALLSEAGFGDAEDLHDPSLNDTALMIVSQDSLSALAVTLGDAVDALMTMTEVHQLEGQGLWLAQHLSAALQSQMMLLATRDALPAQVPATLRATAALANALSLTVPDLPWTADRWPLADQVSSIQGLSGVFRAFGVATGPLHQAALSCFESGFSSDCLRDLHREAAIGLVALNSALDQWSAPANAEAATDSEVALIQGALARAREVLEQSTGDTPAD